MGERFSSCSQCPLINYWHSGGALLANGGQKGDLPGGDAKQEEEILECPH